jgi:hypothetical protein
MIEEGQTEGVFEGRVDAPTHARGFDQAMERALRRLPAGQANQPRTYTVTEQVRAHYSPNPGWVVDSYVVLLTPES